MSVCVRLCVRDVTHKNVDDTRVQVLQTIIILGLLQDFINLYEFGRSIFQIHSIMDFKYYSIIFQIKIPYYFGYLYPIIFKN